MFRQLNARELGLTVRIAVSKPIDATNNRVRFGLNRLWFWLVEADHPVAIFDCNPGFDTLHAVVWLLATDDCPARRRARLPHRQRFNGREEVLRCVDTLQRRAYLKSR